MQLTITNATTSLKNRGDNKSLDTKIIRDIQAAMRESYRKERESRIPSAGLSSH
jgi:hypothetical protein